MPYWLFALALSIRLIAMALSNNEDGDAMARLLYSRSVVDDHDFAPSTLWLPGHFYFLAIPYAIGLRASVFPILLTAIISALAAPLAYCLARQFFDRTAALLSGFLIATYALHIRFSIITVSEGPFLTFLLIAIFCYIRYLQEGRLTSLVVGAAAFNMASSMRFEAWIMPFLLVAAYFFNQWLSRQKFTWTKVFRASMFLGGSLIFAISWTLFCYIKYGDPFYLQHQTLEDSVRYFAALPPYSGSNPPGIGYRLAFFPSVAVLSIGPIAAIASFCGLVNCVARKQSGSLTYFTVAIVAFVLSQIMLKNLIPQARYFLTVCALLLLFVGPGCTQISRWLEPRINKNSLVYAVAIMAIAWPFVIAYLAATNVGWFSQKMYSLSPNPRFEQSVLNADDWLRKHWAKEGSLVFLLGGSNFAGPWSSLLDDWYGTQTITPSNNGRPSIRTPHFLQQLSDLSPILEAEPCGHVVVSRKIVEMGLSDGLRQMLKPEPEFRSREYMIYSWGAACFVGPANKKTVSIGGNWRFPSS